MSPRPPGAGSADIRALLRERRRAVRADDANATAGRLGVPWVSREPPPAGRGKVTQAQLGGYLGVDRHTVWNWEQGRTLPPAKHLPVLAALLGLSAEESGRLFRLCVGYDPQPDLPAAPPDVIDRTWQAVFHDDRFPVYVVAADVWHVVFANSAFYGAYPFAPFRPGAPDASLLRLVLMDEAKEVMVPHDTWAGGLVGQIAQSWRRAPEDPYLFALVISVTSDPRWQSLWQHRDRPPVHPDLSRRVLVHPECGRTEVVLTSFRVDHLGDRYRVAKVVPAAWVDRVLGAQK
jgi:transcriptional regulator with XRE-family HTH domain